MFANIVQLLQVQTGVLEAAGRPLGHSARKLGYKPRKKYSLPVIEKNWSATTSVDAPNRESFV
jgi:hypothetical protein